MNSSCKVDSSRLIHFCMLKGARSGLKQFLTTKDPLNMMKNVFYLTLKALSVLKIFKFLS